MTLVLKLGSTVLEQFRMAALGQCRSWWLAETILCKDKAAEEDVTLIHQDVFDAVEVLEPKFDRLRKGRCGDGKPLKPLVEIASRSPDEVFDLLVIPGRSVLSSIRQSAMRADAGSLVVQEKRTRGLLILQSTRSRGCAA